MPKSISKGFAIAQRPTANLSEASIASQTVICSLHFRRMSRWRSAVESVISFCQSANPTGNAAVSLPSTRQISRKRSVKPDAPSSGGADRQRCTYIGERDCFNRLLFRRKTGCTAASTARIAAIPADKRGRSFRNITITSFTIQHVPDFDSGFGNMNAAICFAITDIIPDVNMFWGICHPLDRGTAIHVLLFVK